LASHTDIISSKFKMGKITKTSCLESTSSVLDGNNPNRGSNYYSLHPFILFIIATGFSEFLVIML